MVVVIFESWPKPSKSQTYLDMAAALMPLVQGVDGFLSIERFQSLSDDGKLVALSFWRDETAVTAWRNLAAHRQIQASSRVSVFDRYRLRVAQVTRDYTQNDRRQAPSDSAITSRDSNSLEQHPVPILPSSGEGVSND